MRSIGADHDEQAQRHSFPPPDGVGDTAGVHFHLAPGPRDSFDSTGEDHFQPRQRLRHGAAGGHPGHGDADL